MANFCLHGTLLFRSDNYAELQAAGYAVLGCSADTPELQSMWKDKQSFPYDLLCDQDRTFVSAVGMAKSGSGVKRGNVVVGPDGVVVQSGLFSPADSVAAAVALANGGGGAGS